MKKKFWLFVTMLVTMFVASACGDDDEPGGNEPEGGGTHVSAVIKESVLKSHEAVSLSLIFNATDTWRAKADADWVKLSTTQGIAGASKKLTVDVAENPTTEERVAVVTVETIKDGIQLAKLTVTQPGRTVVESEDENPNAPAGMRLNASGLVKSIVVGWNLGNTCESGIWDGWSGDDLTIETNWGNPYTTKEMITALKTAGFNAIRIPTRWCVHADGDMNINDRWMNRVKEIVDYAVSQDMYVVLNSHHDNWYDRLPVGYNEADIHKKFENMWRQIATAFKDYDEHLIFAGVNEIIRLNADGGENWNAPTNEHIAFANNLMQLFVNTVRATGGNNEWRCLMVQAWAASPVNALNSAYKLPEDKTPKRIIQEFHCYDPYNYAIGKGQADNKWAQHEFTEKDKQDIISLFSRLRQKFVDAGTPCIMAEFGSTQDNSYSKGEAAADQIRADYHEFIVSEAKKNGIPGLYWDNNCFTSTGENFGLLDRNTCSFPSRAKIALDGIMRGVK